VAEKLNKGKVLVTLSVSNDNYTRVIARERTVRLQRNLTNLSVIARDRTTRLQRNLTNLSVIARERTMRPQRNLTNLLSLRGSVMCDRCNLHHGLIKGQCLRSFLATPAKPNQSFYRCERANYATSAKPDQSFCHCEGAYYATACPERSEREAISTMGDKTPHLKGYLEISW
jgi:hypothetical protein